MIHKQSYSTGKKAKHVLGTPNKFTRHKAHLSIVQELLSSHVDELEVTLAVIDILSELLLLVQLVLESFVVLRNVALGVGQLPLCILKPLLEGTALVLVLVEVVGGVTNLVVSLV